MTVHPRAWLVDDDTSWLRGDVVAGITLAAYLLPSAIETLRRTHSAVASMPAEANQTVDDVVNKWRGALSTVA